VNRRDVVVPGRLDACRGVQALKVPYLVRLRQRHDQAGGASPRGPAGAVQVVLVIAGRIEVDHELDAADIDPARGDVGRD
jgi:hypothetical protein